MGWMIRHCSWVLNRIQVKGDRRTACKHLRGKEHDKQVEQFVKVCLFRNSDADDAKLELRWTEGVFSGQDCDNPRILLADLTRSTDTSSSEETSWTRNY